ncbi:MAG: phosphoglucomutase/phosphomannomutase family protein [Cyanobacteria bacterium P01_F01_bin.150]
MAAKLSPNAFIGKPIKFGTDGWRGLIAADFTYDRVAVVAPLAAIALKQSYGDTINSNTVIVGYDRRFMAEDFAQIAAEAIAAVGFDVMLSECYAPTPSFSWAAFDQKALGAVVLTASHNPGSYLGLKVKGGFGGSVTQDVTQKIEAMLPDGVPTSDTQGTITAFNPWPSYCQSIRDKVDIGPIKEAIAAGKLTVFADVMHGSAASGVEQILGCSINELNGNRDPLFDGGAPEPLPKYLPDLLGQIKDHSNAENTGLTVGLVFDGDSDRIAAVDGKGNFLSSQILIPILIEYLATRRSYKGEVIKTISGSNLFPKVAALYDLPVYETPIGYKYIADRMLEAPALLGGEESGGIGYGHHIPERDALLSSMYVLDAVVQSGMDLSDLYSNLQTKTNYVSQYDRIDLPLANMEVRAKLLETLQNNTPTEVAGHAVTDCLTIDGYKFTLKNDSWLLIRFSGTEPVLRLYSEALTMEEVQANLAWAKDWATSL